MDDADRKSIRDRIGDLGALIVTLFGEARGEPILGQIAVANVIRNRVLATPLPRSYRAVCTAPWQFSCWWETSENADRTFALAQAVITVSGLPSLVGPDRTAFRQVDWIAQGVFSGDLSDDPTHGATHYLTAELYRVKPPAWAVGKSILAEVGQHVFLRAAEA